MFLYLGGNSDIRVSVINYIFEIGGLPMYKIVIEFEESNILSVNADDPGVAVVNAQRLISDGRLIPRTKCISVFNVVNEIEEEEPIHEVYF
jgi:hypothetical protein